MDMDGDLPDWMPNLTLMEWVVVGVVVVVILIGLCGCCCCCCVWKKKKRRREREKWARRVNYEEKKESDKATLIQKSLAVERERHDLEREKWMDTEVERRIQTELEKKETVPQPKVELAVDLDQLNKVEQQVELLVELARHGSSVNTTIQGYNSRDQLLMELARAREMDSRGNSRELLMRTGHTESYRAESESYQGSQRMGTDRWADSGPGSELNIDLSREHLIRSPERVRSPKLMNEGKIRITSPSIPMKIMKQAEPVKQTDDELKRLVQELREREREKLIQELREEARAKLVEELALRDSPVSQSPHSERHFEKSNSERSFEKPMFNSSERSSAKPKSNKTESDNFKKPKHLKSERERQLEQAKFERERIRSLEHSERHYENPAKGLKSPLLRELETQRKETLHNIDVEKVQLMKTESKLMIAPELTKNSVREYAGGWIADHREPSERGSERGSEPWRVKDLQSPSVMRHEIDHDSGSDTYSEEDSEEEGPQRWKRLRSPDVAQRRQGELNRQQKEEQARLVQELLDEEREMLEKVESQQQLFQPKEPERPPPSKRPEPQQQHRPEPERHFEKPKHNKPERGRPDKLERNYENPQPYRQAEPLSDPPPPLPPRPVRPDKAVGDNFKQSNLTVDCWTDTDTKTSYSETERLMGLSQLESDEDNQWSEEDSDVMSSRSEVERNEWIKSEQARWIQAEEVERKKYQRAML